MNPHPVVIFLWAVVALVGLFIGVILGIVNGRNVFLVYLVVLTLLVGLSLCLIFFDRFAVLLIRFFNIRVFPEAINLAMSIYSRPDNWTVRGRDLHHVHVGTLDARIVGELNIVTRNGTWNPNAVERRIIFEAASWHINHIKEIKTSNLKHQIMQSLIQPVIATGE